MPDNVVSIVFAVLFLGLWAAVLIRLVIKAVRNKYAATKNVSATVIDKHITETISKYSGTGKQEKYVVVFSVKGKKKGFYVTQFSYNGYRLGETGTLTYKGDRLISFQ